ARRRAARLHHGAERGAVHDEPARAARRRRGGHHTGARRARQRDRRRPRGARRRARGDAGDARARVAGDRGGPPPPTPLTMAARGALISATAHQEVPMPRTYNVIDADGHVLEPIDIWDKYIDPAFRDRAPRIVRDTDGKERLDVEGQRLGSQKGFGVIGAIGARQGEVDEETMQYIDGRKGGFDPHARIPDMDLDGIDAAFLYPSVGLFAGAIKDPALAAAVCRAYNRWLADYCSPYPDRLFGV